MGTHIASVCGVERHFIRHICSIHEWENFTVRARCVVSLRKSQRKSFHFAVQSLSWKIIYSEYSKQELLGF